MAFRVVLIENEIDAKIKLDNLVLNTCEGEIWIPVSDISIIVLDNLRITLSTRFLCTLAKNNVSLILCDEKHLPIGCFVLMTIIVERLSIWVIKLKKRKSFMINCGKILWLEKY